MIPDLHFDQITKAVFFLGAEAMKQAATSLVKTAWDRVRTLLGLNSTPTRTEISQKLAEELARSHDDIVASLIKILKSSRLTEVTKLIKTVQVNQPGVVIEESFSHTIQHGVVNINGSHLRDVQVFPVASTKLVNSRRSHALELARSAKDIVTKLYERTGLELAERLAREATETDSMLSLAWAIRARISALFLSRGWVGDDEPKKMISDAQTFANNALQLNEEESDAYFCLGLVEAFQHRFREADVYYEQALKVAPLDAAITSSLGLSKIAQGRLQDALQLFQTSADLDPGNPLRYFDLAVLYAGAKEYEKSWQEASRATSIHPIANAILIKAWLAAAWKGDTDEMKAVLDGLRPQDRCIDEAVHFQMWSGLLRREPVEVLNAASRIQKTYIEHRFAFSGPVAWHTALAHHLAQNDRLAKESWIAAEGELEKRLDESPHGLHTHYRVQLATTLVWLGRRHEANDQVQLAEADWGISELTASRARELAGYYASLGDAKHAVALIKRAFGPDSGPGGLTVALLRLDPWWDRLRVHKDFQDLISNELVPEHNSPCTQGRLIRKSPRGESGRLHQTTARFEDEHRAEDCAQFPMRGREAAHS